MSRVSAGKRVQRLLVIIPWVAQHPGGVAIEEVCERFDISSKDLVKDLDSILPYVGVSPFTPDTLMEVNLSEDWVSIRPQWFDRPPRLTPGEAFAILTAGAGLADLPGYDPEGPLASAIAKIATVVVGSPEGVPDVDLTEVDANVKATLDEAVSQHRAVEIDHYSSSSDTRSRRVVEPSWVGHQDGNWYLWGHCRTAGAQRTFRLDRIADAVLLDETFEPPAVDPGRAVFQPTDEAPSVTLDLDASGVRILERVPHEVIEDLEDGGKRVRLVVSGRPYLERLLLILGPHGRVTEADASLGGAGRAAAERVRARYGR